MMTATHDTTTDELQQLFALQQAAFKQSPWPNAAQRKDRLARLKDLLRRNEERFIEAIALDFGHRSAHETRLAEIFFVRNELAHLESHLARWMRPRRVPTQWLFWPGRNQLVPQPLGVVGVIVPWNYPLQLSLAPAAVALAAGNRVIIKPSEFTPHFNSVLQELIAVTFLPEEIAVVTGELALAKAFTQLPFDHLFFTGSTAVGRQVATSAAAQLTPLTLELGGKSPVVIDTSATARDMGWIARRVAYGKLLNAGQTCIAPDYVLLPQAQREAFVQAYTEAVAQMYPKLKNNPDYSTIINSRNYERLQQALSLAVQQGARVLEINPMQETFDAESRKLAPALVLHNKPLELCLTEEIFGPILPVVTYRERAEIVPFLAHYPKPLALYWFGHSRRARHDILQQHVSGGVTVNDCLLHIAQLNQPFGGVGPSGQGMYHGQWGFDAMSKLKPIFYANRFFSGSALFAPPYGKGFDRLYRLLSALK